MTDNSRNSRRWMFTLNNPTEEEEQHLLSILGSNETVYGVFGRETAPTTGTRHFQGYVVFRRNKRLGAVKRLLGDRYYLDKARSDSRICREYCIKDGDFVEFGSVPFTGRRSDVDALVEWMADFESEHGRPPSSPDVAIAQPHGYLRFPRLVSLARHRSQPRRLEFGEPRDWQRQLEQELIGEADDRSIIFYVDEEGNTGKSWFQRWFYSEHPAITQLLSVGKRDDIAFMIDESRRVFLFNIPRDSMQYVNYSVLEMLKDRVVSSPKYTSHMKVLRAVPHVVVFCNEHPDYSKLSEDRIVVRNVE